MVLKFEAVAFFYFQRIKLDSGRVSDILPGKSCRQTLGPDADKQRKQLPYVITFQVIGTLHFVDVFNRNIDLFYDGAHFSCLHFRRGRFCVYSRFTLC